ncbi:MAG TPA: FAD/NAD(P)-binding oxidoreductase [Acidobacteriaceae bacterium]|nr:FAD/NAD(P)-binding oxidoreductase [Acidobacteriaceae bacterium]
MTGDTNRTDVLVVGAGPAGIAAATAAARHGLKTIVLDDNPSAGGQIWRDAIANPHAKKEAARERAIQSLRASGAQLLSGRSVFAADATGAVWAAREGGPQEEFRYQSLILATGARERFLPFPGWTLPGVFGAGGLQALVKGGYPVAGKRVVVAGTGPLLLAVAKHLAEDGAKVVRIVEQAPLKRLMSFAASLATNPAKLLEGLRFRPRAPYSTGCWVTEAIGATEGQKLSAVRISGGVKTWSEPCDLLAGGYNLVPNTEIAELLRCAFRGSFVRVDDSQRTSVPHVFCVGEPTGIAGLDAALVQGEIAGLACAGKSDAALTRRAAQGRAFADRLEKAFALRDELRSLPHADTIVCRCEDVPAGKLRDRLSWTDAKLQTRCGMGPCQGRVCGPAIEFLMQWRPVSVRQPILPVPMQAFFPGTTAAESAAQTETESIEERV